MNRFIQIITASIILFGLTNCSEKKSEYNGERPNILWIVLEDTNPLMGCYGETRIKTPNIDQLAVGGLKFTNAIMPSPVCSSSRSSMITGIMSTTLGTHNHHSSRTPESAIQLPEEVNTIPEVFKSAGYFTFNNGKDDYNFTYDRKNLYDQDYQTHPLYGKKGKSIPLEELVGRQPFFGQIQLYGGKEIFSSEFEDRVNTPVDRSLIDLPPYLPEHPDLIEEYADHLDAIQITDRRVGKIMEQLEQSGLLKNTVVFFFSDHGMRITRHKQFLYEGGLKVPLIIKDFRENRVIEQEVRTGLVSGIDLGPTSLGLAGIDVPDNVEGVDIFSESFKGRDYVISTRDRCDFTIDRIRSVRTKKYKYIRNFLTDRPYTQPTYMDVGRVPFVLTMKQLKTENKLDSIQALFMAEERPAEELYDLENDPFEINNLANEPSFISELEQHRQILKNWMEVTDDKGQYPEDEENLKLMLGIWGMTAVNPEYEALRKKYPALSGSQFELKSSKWQ